MLLHDRQAFDHLPLQSEGARHLQFPGRHGSDQELHVPLMLHDEQNGERIEIQVE